MTVTDLKEFDAIVKYAVFPVIGFAAGFLAKWFLQSRKARDELLKALATRRAESLEALWKLTTPFARSPEHQAALDRRIKADDELRKWYFEDAGALFLSWQGTKCYFEAVDCLRDKASAPESLKRKFSLLRTALKRDVGIYTRWSSWRQLPEPRTPLGLANQGAAADAARPAPLSAGR